MRRVLVIGSGGAGKSTVSYKLRSITGLPLIHLDHKYWGPGWVETSKDEWEKVIEDLCKQSEWIMDGNYLSTLPQRLEACDTVIFLNYSRLVCIQGALKRRFFEKRIDEIPGCREQMDMEFFSWIWNFKNSTAPIIVDLLRNCDGKSIYIAENRSDLNKIIKEIESSVQQQI